MNICVVGWYMTPELYELLKNVHKRHPVYIVSHKQDSDEFLHSTGLPYALKPNIGLEFGAYDYYIKNVWQNGNTLFMHDDTVATDAVFDEIAKLDVDQAYIFKDAVEEKSNGGQHGRGIYISDRLIQFMLGYVCRCHHITERVDPHHGNGRILPANPPHTGFFFDKYNTGHTDGSPPDNVCHYNDMIYHFHRYMGWIRDQRLGNEKMNVVNRVFFNDFRAGRRGVWREI